MRFDYAKPSDLKEIATLKANGGVLFSGGTDVFVKMRNGVIAPKLLIDTKGIETPKIECVNGKMKIYMNATYRDLLESDCLKGFPLLREIVQEVGSTQIRNRGTPIGNIGNASPAGDFLLAAYLYDAVATIAPSMRKVEIPKLISGPGKLSLSEEEFIYSVEFYENRDYIGYYEKVGKRNAMVISIASLGLLLKVGDGRIEDVKIAFGSVGPTIVRYREFEEEYKDSKFDLKTFSELARGYMNMVKPISDVRASAEYRRLLVRNLLLKAFLSIERSSRIQC